ncbi:MAG: 1-aminocyclopropane-1-carboxylate deaminase/D-cysteine desulfhydrase [Cellvibrionaceae bacterium]
MSIIRERDSNLAELLQLEPEQWALHAPLQTINFAPFQQAGVELSIKREDLLHRHLSGNKLYKLFGHLQQAKRLGATCLSSFGGYYSNHLHALAYAGEALGVKTHAIVRGHRPKVLSATLKDCSARGMALEFVSRLDYAELKNKCLGESLQQRLQGQSYWVPEGGGAIEGIAGCAAIVQGIKSQLEQRLPQKSAVPLTLCVPVGTGTTAAGILSQLAQGDSLLGYSALRFGDGLADVEASVRQLSGNERVSWQLFDESHFGGFAKTRADLFQFMEAFTRATGILLDPIYTAKTLYHMTQQVQDGYWQSGQHLVMVHTGGLQGRRGFDALVSASDNYVNDNNEKNNLVGVR